MNRTSALHANLLNREVSFDDLFKAYWQLLFHISLRKTGVEEDAYDIVQDLFIEIWENQGDMLSKCSDRSFLISCLYNKIFLYFRKKGVQTKHYEDFKKYVLIHDAISVPDSELNEAEAHQSTIRQIIRNEITNMPDKMKEIFMLNSMEDYSIEEIAEKLSLSRQTVKNQLVHARKRLRALFYFLELVGLLIEVAASF